jgi:hypothetical protein
MEAVSGIDATAAGLRGRVRFASAGRREGLAADSLRAGLSDHIAPKARSGEEERWGNKRGRGFQIRFTNKS